MPARGCTRDAGLAEWPVVAAGVAGSSAGPGSGASLSAPTRLDTGIGELLLFFSALLFSDLEGKTNLRYI